MPADGIQLIQANPRELLFGKDRFGDDADAELAAAPGQPKRLVGGAHSGRESCEFLTCGNGRRKRIGHLTRDLFLDLGR